MLSQKIKTQKALQAIAVKIARSGRKIVFTNGCFDILHAGHIDYLTKAKRLADVLIVGLNSDSSVRKIKGKKRPVVKQKDRAMILAALECVDYITIFSQKTPDALIRLVKPHLLIKGADWKKSKIVGKEFVESYGGKIVTIPLLKGCSTSSIIKKIKNA